MKYQSEFSLDDPRTTLRHREIILEKPFLKNIYIDWYSNFMNIIPELPNGKMLEIGSGGGFLKKLMPSVITSDILPLPHCDMLFSAEQMPFEANELSAIFMVNVFHHIPRPYLFLREAERTLKKGGLIIMIEPANTFLSRFIYKKFHHEPFEETGAWEIQTTGPLSGSNQALPYIYCIRDKEKFQKEFPHLRIKKIVYHTPFKYILSGGVSRHALLPNWSYKIISFVEMLCAPLMKQIALFNTITIERI